MNKITIIGGGNLGSAIANGLLESGFVRFEDLTITKRNTGSLEKFSKKGVEVTSNNELAIANSNIIIIALKPYQVKEFLKEHANCFGENKIVISAVTGVSILELKPLLNDKLILFRVMPNTAIAIRESVTCIAYENAGNEQIDFVREMFQKLGKVIFIEEKLMDSATVLGACGTAFAMRYIRASIQGGIEIGFDANIASYIAAQTVKGAAQLLLLNGTHPEQEIDKVTTPKGCTITGLNEMEHQGFSSALIKGIISSFEKIKTSK